MRTTASSWRLLYAVSGKVISNPSFNFTLTKVAQHGPISSMIVISRGFVKENN